MTLDISPQAAEFLQQRMATGLYASVEDVVFQGIRLLVDHEEAVVGIRRGIEAMERGEGVPIEQAFEGIRCRHGLTDAPRAIISSTNTRARQRVEGQRMSNLDEIRKRRLHCERALRESVLVLIGIFFLVSVLAAIALFMTAKVNFQTLLLLFPTVLATLIGLPVTWGVTRLQPWTRRPLTILSLFGLLFFPFGTIFSFLIFKAIYLGESPQLLTHDYYSIVQQTQHLNHRTSLLTWIGFALIILLFASVALILLIPPEYRQ